jgi:hypothetical protein
MIKIHNLRAGFATNSSSSHSIILLPDSVVGPVSAAYDTDADDDFGWGEFFLASQEAKLRYLAAQIVSRTKDDAIIARLLAEMDVHAPRVADQLRLAQAGGFQYGDFPYVDHQSVYGAMDVEGVEEFVKFFMSPHVAILGGNDNADYGVLDRPNFPNGAKPFDGAQAYFGREGGSSGRVRRDGEFVTIMDEWSGNKVRFSFNPDDHAGLNYTKASAPELVDVKITNYCAKGCNFCYQSSTTEGLHAPMADIQKVFETLAAMEVFEIAIGGGEPTSHPDFGNILILAKGLKMKPNFTTLTDAWLEDDALIDIVRETVGGIGVSCLDKKGLALVEKIDTALKGTRGYTRVKIMAQHVVGSVPLEVTGEFINAAFEKGIPVLLLGFKDVGFGATYKRHDVGEVETFLALAVGQHHKGVSLSVDTALVDTFPGFLKALNVPDALVSSPEGKFSCYVDAVEMTMGASSYVQPTEMEPFQADVADFKNAFKAY